MYASSSEEYDIPTSRQALGYLGRSSYLALYVIYTYLSDVLFFPH